MIARSLFNDVQMENILVGIYVVFSPLLGYFISWLIDDYKSSIAIKPLTIFIVGVPSIIFLFLKDNMSLERIALDSYAVGGLYSHFALICLFAVKKQGLLSKFIFFFIIIIFLLDLYYGGSRRYMVPIVFVLIGMFVFLYRYKKNLLVTIILLLISLPLAIVSFNRVENFSTENPF